VLYLKGTPTEETVFQETEPSVEFNRFLEFLGTKVDVAAFPGYRGDLKGLLFIPSTSRYNIHHLRGYGLSCRLAAPRIHLSGFSFSLPPYFSILTFVYVLKKKKKKISCFMTPDRRRPLIGNSITTLVYLEDGIFDLSTITSTVLRIFFNLLVLVHV